MKPPDQDGPGLEFGRFHSRVRGAPEVFGQFPISCLAEEIDTPGDGQLRALITVAGNPVVSAPGAAGSTRRCRLDAMIAVDNWLNETTRHAHVILPGLSPLERPHADDLYWIYAISSCVKWSDPVFAPDPDRPPEWEILLRLAGAMVGMPMPDVDVAAMDDLYVARPGRHRVRDAAHPADRARPAGGDRRARRTRPRTSGGLGDSARPVGRRPRAAPGRA